MCVLHPRVPECSLYVLCTATRDQREKQSVQYGYAYEVHPYGFLVPRLSMEKKVRYPVKLKDTVWRGRCRNGQP
jgi:hypothetical protein